MLLPANPDSLGRTSCMTKYDLLGISRSVWHPAYIESFRSIYCMRQCSRVSTLWVSQISTGNGLQQAVK